MKASDILVPCSKAVAYVLQEIIDSSNGSKHLKFDTSLSRNPFTSHLKMKMSLFDYFKRLGGYLHISDSCFILALIYIDRVTEANPYFVINSDCIHRLVSASLSLAVKYNEDQRPWTTDYFCQVVGTTPELQLKLESEFLKLIDFRIFVNKETCKQYYKYTMNVAMKAIRNKYQNDTVKFASTCSEMMKNCSCHQPAHFIGYPTSRQFEIKIKKTLEDNCQNYSKAKGKFLIILFGKNFCRFSK